MRLLSLLFAFLAGPLLRRTFATPSHQMQLLLTTFLLLIFPAWDHLSSEIKYVSRQGSAHANTSHDTAHCTTEIAYNSLFERMSRWMDFHHSIGSDIRPSAASLRFDSRCAYCSRRAVRTPRLPAGLAEFLYEGEENGSKAMVGLPLRPSHIGRVPQYVAAVALKLETYWLPPATCHHTNGVLRQLICIFEMEKSNFICFQNRRS
jgi:hypothetical protein